MSVNKNVVMEYQKVPLKDIEHNEKTDIPDSYGYGVRHIQILIGFMSLSVGFITRGHMGVTIVAMTNTLDTKALNLPINAHNNISMELDKNPTAWEDMDYENETIFNIDFETENNTIEIYERGKIHYPDRDNGTDIGINRKYSWSKPTQEMVLSAFFLGYTIMMIPMGILSQKFGGKLPMQIALFVNGVASIIAPWMAAWGGWKAVCACRILQGLSQAAYFPGLNMIVAKWSSPGERGTFFSWAFTGSTFGTVISFQIAGLLAATWGWPSTFWVTGSLCLVMFLILTVFGSAMPSQHKFISEKERMFIMGKVDGEVKKPKLPLKVILKNKHVWASWCTHVASGVAFVFFFSQTPTYIHYILDVDVRKSGLLSSLPYFANFVASIIYGPLSDFLTNRNILSLKNARRVSNTYSQFGMAICFLAVSFTKNVTLAVMCLVLAMMFQSAQHTGWMVNYIDLSPNFSGSLISFGNTMACCGILTLPLLVSFVLTDVTNQVQWRIIFVIMASLVAAANIVYVIFMSADTQPWNEYGYENTETEEKEDESKGKKTLNDKTSRQE